MTKAFEMMILRRKETLTKLQKTLRELEKTVPESEFLQYEPCEVATSNVIRGAAGMVVMSVNYLVHILENAPSTLRQMESEVAKRASKIPEA